MLGRQGLLPSPPPPSRGHSQHTWGTGTPYPGLVKSEAPVSASFLLLPLCLESGVSTFLSSPGGEELSLCKTEGQRGEPELLRHWQPMPRCTVRKCFSLRRSKQQGLPGASQLPSRSWLLPPPAHPSPLSKEASDSLMQTQGLWDSSLGRDVSRPSLIRPEPVSHLASELVLRERSPALPTHPRPAQRFRVIHPVTVSGAQAGLRAICGLCVCTCACARHLARLRHSARVAEGPIMISHSGSANCRTPVLMGMKQPGGSLWMCLTV